jgi:hypothetical protein
VLNSKNHQTDKVLACSLFQSFFRTESNGVWCHHAGRKDQGMKVADNMDELNSSSFTCQRAYAISHLFSSGQSAQPIMQLNLNNSCLNDAQAKVNGLEYTHSIIIRYSAPCLPSDLASLQLIRRSAGLRFSTHRPTQINHFHPR